VAVKVYKNNIGALIAVIVVTLGIVSSFAVVFAFSGTYVGRTFVRVIKGDLSFDGAVTRIVLEHRMALRNVPEKERRELESVLDGIPDKLEGTAEGDRRELAGLIINAGTDGEITGIELAAISSFIEEITE
jgi:hypothetical protein